MISSSISSRGPCKLVDGASIAMAEHRLLGLVAKKKFLAGKVEIGKHRWRVVLNK